MCVCVFGSKTEDKFGTFFHNFFDLSFLIITIFPLELFLIVDIATSFAISAGNCCCCCCYAAAITFTGVMAFANVFIFGFGIRRCLITTRMCSVDRSVGC